MEPRSAPDAAFAATFTKESGALRRLARSLVADAAAAEDVVQETWAAYWKRPPAEPAKAGAFLATLTRRLAWRARRGEARRKERERFAARGEPTPGPDELAERAGALREVLDALATLREPYRRALWQRYFDDLPPREIARASGENLATVKSRLQRGLELLREELDRRHGGRRSSWAVALAPFAGGASFLGLGISGGFVMGSALKLSAAALVIAALGGLWLWSSRAESAVTLPELAANAKPAGPTLEAGQVQAAPEGARSAVADPAPPADPPLVVDPELAHPHLYMLVVRVQDEYGLFHNHPDLRIAPVRSAMNVAQPIAEVDGASTLIWRGKEPEMDVDVQFGSSGRMQGSKRVHVRAGTPNEVVLFGASQIQNRVVRVSGSLLVSFRAAAVEARLDSFSESGVRMERFPHPHARFGDRFVQREVKPIVAKVVEENVVPGEVSELRLLSGKMVATSALLDGAALQSTDSRPTARVSIHVVDDKGEPAKSVLVALGEVVDGFQGGYTFTDEHGDAVLERVEGGWMEARAGGGAGGLARERLFVDAPNALQWNARLERGARVFGRVASKEGAEPPSKLVVRFESTPDIVSRGTTVRMTLETNGGEEISERGESRERAPGEIRAPWVDQALVREDGTFELTNLPPGLGRLMFLRDGATGEHALAVVESVLPGENEWIIADPRAELGAIVLRVQLPIAAPDDRLEARAICEATGRGTALAAGEDGTLSSTSLAAGWYRVELGAGCMGWHDLGRQYVEAGARVDLGTFTPPLPAIVRVIPPVPAEGRPTPLELTFYLRRPDLDIRGEPRELGDGMSLSLPAGDYWVFWKGSDGAQLHRGLKLEAGSNVELDLR